MSIDDQRDARFTNWWAEHRGIVHKIARAYATEANDRSDLQQEMLLQLWRSGTSFREQAKASTWVYRVCLNTALTWLRDVKRRAIQVDGGVIAAETLTDAATPAKNADEGEMLQQLYAAIRTMTDFDRGLVLLMLDGVSYREIAEVTGLTENHVGVALMRARRRLAEIMKGVIDELE